MLEWLVVRKEKHIDDKYLVFTDVDRALAAAKEIAAYWEEQYAGAEIDRMCYGDTIFSVSGESVFSVEVMPISINGEGLREGEAEEVFGSERTEKPKRNLAKFEGEVVGAWLYCGEDL